MVCSVSVDVLHLRPYEIVKGGCYSFTTLSKLMKAHTDGGGGECCAQECLAVDDWQGVVCIKMYMKYVGTRHMQRNNARERLFLSIPICLFLNASD